MSYYLILNASQQVMRVESADEAPTPVDGTAVLVGAWMGWPSPPASAPAAVLAYRGDAFVWDDLRTLAQAASDQIAALNASYSAAIAASVSFTTAAGVTQTFQADPGSVNEIAQTMLGYQEAKATPSGFYWVAQDNTQVPFAYADLQGLSAAVMAQGWTAFAKLQMLKAQVRAATTLAQVTAITWS